MKIEIWIFIVMKAWQSTHSYQSWHYSSVIQTVLNSRMANNKGFEQAWQKIYVTWIHFGRWLSFYVSINFPWSLTFIALYYLKGSILWVLLEVLPIPLLKGRRCRFWREVLEVLHQNRSKAYTDLIRPPEDRISEKWVFGSLCVLYYLTFVCEEGRIF